VRRVTGLLLASKRQHSDIVEESSISSLPVLQILMERAELFQLAMTFLNLRRTDGADQALWKKISRKKSRWSKKEAHIAQLQALVLDRDRALEDLRAALKEYAEHLTALQKKSETLERDRAELQKTISWRIHAHLGESEEGL